MPVDQLSVAFSALADPTRRDILSRLRGGPVTVSELAANYTISRPAVSQHLKVLEAAGLIARSPRAQWRECALEAGGLDEATRWLEQQRNEWSSRLDDLAEHLASRGHAGSTTETEEGRP
ncbi:winged helix-turn-helix transcriptional regulator [Microbacteriaceae bacterium VKM Ac-2855]|nr:winged helix-turn-helix transcriptional regulator [Microbacteriaceae bacterium VKM Ac-2855]